LGCVEGGAGEEERESGGRRAGERGKKSGRAGERETVTIYLKSQISNLKFEI
jgi:hypothetical protein